MNKKQIWNQNHWRVLWADYKCEDFLLHNVKATSVEKVLKNLDVAKAFGIDQISGNFLKDGASVTAIHLANIINLSIKFDMFSHNPR